MSSSFREMPGGSSGKTRAQRVAAAPAVARVSRFSITLIKGLALHHPDEIQLAQWGAVGDRDFFLIDGRHRPVSVKSAGRLVTFAAEHDREGNRLILRSDSGQTWGGVIELGDRVVCDFYGVRQVVSRLVDGPWARPLSVAAGQPLQLARAEVPGAASDIHPVTLLSQESLSELAQRSQLREVDARRFRMLIEVKGGAPHVEDTWNGKIAAVGNAVLKIRGPVPRCAAVTRDPTEGDRDLPTLEMIRSYRGVQEHERGRGVNFGVYADVLKQGPVRVGDALRLT
jgi:uncharacterized protein YcbX